MKKIYVSPAMKVVSVGLRQMMAGSQSMTIGGNYDGSSKIESRGNDDTFWDEDEE